MIYRCMVGLGVAAIAALAGGCQSIGDLSGFVLGKGSLAVQSAELNNDTLESTGFDIAIYSVEDPETLHMLLIEGTEDQPVRAVHVRMFWRPRAGRTPLDPTATNTTVRYIVFEGEQVGIYGGGGLLRPNADPGGKRWNATLRNATLRLLDKSEGFEGPLGDAAVAAGSVTVERDELRTLTLLRKITAQVEDRLGYPRLVGTSPAR